MSFDCIEEIPVTLNNVCVFVILYSRSVVIGVNAIGDCITPSIDINAFSFFLNISNSWALPEPVPVNVTAIPATASGRDFDILKVSFVNLIAYTSEPKVPPAVAIPVNDTPSNVEPGAYANLSPVSKKWSFIVNIPVDGSKLAVSVGLNCFWNIGVKSLWRTKLVLLDLEPFNASYCAINKDSETVPYCKLGGVFNKSSSV